MTALRIVVLTTFYPPYSFGGDGASVQRLARALAQRGHAVTVIHDENAFQSLGGRLDQTKGEKAPDGVEVVGLRSRFGLISNILVQQTGHAVIHSRKLQQLVAERKPDIIWHNNVSLMGAPGILGLKAPLQIYEAHEHWLICPTHVLWRYDQKPCESRNCLRCVLAHRRPPQLWRATGLLDRKLKHMDVIIAKSQFSRDKHYAYGLKQEMEVLPLFLPPLATSEAGRHEGQDGGMARCPEHPRPYFLFVGRLEKIKGVQDLLPPIRRHGQADLLIAGDGPYTAMLKDMASDNPRVHFLGRVAPSRLSRYYKDAIATVVPSLCYETFGAILIESFRMGTPVISRRLGPFPEIVDAAGGGLLFDTEDDLTTALAELQNDARKRKRYSAAALHGFETIWREDRVLAAYGTVLARAARRKSQEALAQKLEDTLC